MTKNLSVLTPSQLLLKSIGLFGLYYIYHPRSRRSKMIFWILPNYTSRNTAPLELQRMLIIRAISLLGLPLKNVRVPTKSKPGSTQIKDRYDFHLISYKPINFLSYQYKKNYQLMKISNLPNVRVSQQYYCYEIDEIKRM